MKRAALINTSRLSDDVAQQMFVDYIRSNGMKKGGPYYDKVKGITYTIIVSDGLTIVTVEDATTPQNNPKRQNMGLIYIIGNTTGNPLYKQQIDNAERVLKKRFICNVLTPPHRESSLVVQGDLARLSYQTIAAADAVALLWTSNQSHSATLEYLIAQEAGKTIIRITEQYKIIMERGA